MFWPGRGRRQRKNKFVNLLTTMSDYWIFWKQCPHRWYTCITCFRCSQRIFQPVKNVILLCVMPRVSVEEIVTRTTQMSLKVNNLPTQDLQWKRAHICLKNCYPSPCMWNLGETLPNIAYGSHLTFSVFFFLSKFITEPSACVFPDFVRQCLKVDNIDKNGVRWWGRTVWFYLERSVSKFY